MSNISKRDREWSKSEEKLDHTGTIYFTMFGRVDIVGLEQSLRGVSG